MGWLNDSTALVSIGLSKVWAEQMAEMYARAYGMSCVAVRIGWCPRDTGEAIELARKGGIPAFLSHADAGRFFALATEAVGPEPGRCAVVSRAAPQCARALPPPPDVRRAPHSNLKFTGLTQNLGQL
jgi:hypothetical protein